MLLFSYYLRKKGCTYRSILSPINKVVLAMCYCQKVRQNKCILLLLTIQNQIQNRVMKVANTCGECGKRTVNFKRVANKKCEIYQAYTLKKILKTFNGQRTCRAFAVSLHTTVCFHDIVMLVHGEVSCHLSC